MRRLATLLILFAIAAAFRPGTASAAEGQYKDYTRRATRSMYFEIGFDKNTIEISVQGDSGKTTVSYRLKDMELRHNAVYFDGVRVFDTAGLSADGQTLPYSEIYDSRVTEQNEFTVVTFFTRSDEAEKLYHVKPGNIINYSENYVVSEHQFVRGLVFSVLGDIDVDGEVNKDVISLFGNVNVGPAAVARGDVVSVTGDITVARHASIYGEVYSAREKRRARRGRFYRPERVSDLFPGFVYDRVDGAQPWLEFRFDDGDSLLPRVDLKAGYAFASSRWRYNVQMEQSVLRSVPIAVGGSLYQKLSSQDNWIIGDNENTFFSLFFAEDYRDYYEANGVNLYVRSRPLKSLTIETRYQYDETNWLRGYRALWSLFGGDRLFRSNFSSVDSGYRAYGMDEIDTTANAGLHFLVDYDTRDREDPFSKSAVVATGQFEWSTPDLNSDFDYRRYTLSLRRYQKLNRHTMILARAMYGGSDGYLPMYKRFFLGGLNTLRGYFTKEYMGTRFWMGNAEYRFSFPHSDLALSVLYDVGQIANDQKLNSEVDVKQSLGLALYVGSDTRISVARRLDRSYNNGPRLYARLSHVF